MKKEKWEELYLQAAVEVDGKKMPERIGAVREAIQARLQELAASRDHHTERINLRGTLKRLDVLETESRRW